MANNTRPSRWTNRFIRWCGAVICLALIALYAANLRWQAGAYLGHTDRWLVILTDGCISIAKRDPGAPLMKYEPHWWVNRVYARPHWQWWFFYSRASRSGGQQTTYAGVPLWFVLLLAAAPTSAAWIRDRRHSAWLRTGACPVCGYDLSGLAPTASCPECGHSGCHQSPRSGALVTGASITSCHHTS